MIVITGDQNYQYNQETVNLRDCITAAHNLDPWVPSWEWNRDVKIEMQQSCAVKENFQELGECRDGTSCNMSHQQCEECEVVMRHCCWLWHNASSRAYIANYPAIWYRLEYMFGIKETSSQYGKLMCSRRKTGKNRWHCREVRTKELPFVDSNLRQPSVVFLT